MARKSTVAAEQALPVEDALITRDRAGLVQTGVDRPVYVWDEAGQAVLVAAADVVGVLAALAEDETPPSRETAPVPVEAALVGPDVLVADALVDQARVVAERVGPDLLEAAAVEAPVFDMAPVGPDVLDTSLVGDVRPSPVEEPAEPVEPPAETPAGVLS